MPKTMKFLGQTKFKQTDNEYLKEFASERPLSSNLLRYAKSCYSVKSSGKAQRDNQLPNSFTCIDAENADDEPFDGFQKIRTLETDLLITDLATPNFGMHIEKKMKQETDTEDELKPVKEKLEKVLLTANNEKEAIIDPLQHEVFSSEVGGPKTTIMEEHRESLWELFQKTNMTEEKSESISSTIIEKKIPKKRMFHHSSKHSTLASVGTVDSDLADENLHKILHMLHRVYTEAIAISQESQNLWKDITNSNFSKAKVSRPIYNGGTNTKCRRECWIKSDADYLILEL